VLGEVCFILLGVVGLELVLGGLGDGREYY